MLCRFLCVGEVISKQGRELIGESIHTGTGANTTTGSTVNDTSDTRGRRIAGANDGLMKNYLLISVVHF